MSVNTEKSIEKMKLMQRAGITYSMYGSRTGDDGTADCSGAVYTALRYGGGSNFGYVPSTETLHAYLNNNGFTLIAENTEWEMKRGDVVIWGKIGQSAGAGGHTGICVDNQNWIECTAWQGAGTNGGVIISNHDSRWAMNGGPYFYVYRYNGKNNSQIPVPDNNIPSNFVPEKGTFVNGDTPIMNRIGTPSTMATAGGYLPAYGTWEYDSIQRIGDYTWCHHLYNGLHIFIPVRIWYADGTSLPYGEFH